jgi:uncharacterized protein YegL
MSGEPIEAVKDGVQIWLAPLRQNPQAIETAFKCNNFDNAQNYSVDRLSFFSNGRHKLPE